MRWLLVLVLVLVLVQEQEVELPVVYLKFLSSAVWWWLPLRMTCSQRHCVTSSRPALPLMEVQ